MGKTSFRALTKDPKLSWDLIEDGNLFQVETALKSNVFTPNAVLYFSYKGRDKVWPERSLYFDCNVVNIPCIIRGPRPWVDLKTSIRRSLRFLDSILPIPFYRSKFTDPIFLRSEANYHYTPRFKMVVKAVYRVHCAETEFYFR